MKFNSKRNVVLSSTFLTAISIAAPMGLGLIASALPQVAMAQSSVGSVSGKSSPGAAVVVKDKETGVSFSTKGDKSGNFSINNLPPGNYTIKSGDFNFDIAVAAGAGTSVNLAPENTIVVKGVRGVKAIDVKSVESTSIYTAAQLQNLPVGRSVSSVALLAPGTVRNGAPGDFGDLVSVGGSSVAENGYYINGFDVTNIFQMISFADLPFDAIGQEQIKTGGYGAEYGRSLGGVVSLVTKRGSNDFHFGGTITTVPQAFRSKAKSILSKDPEDLTSNNQYFQAIPSGSMTGWSRENTRKSTNYSLYASGALIKDKLFVFGLVDGQNFESNSFGRTTSRRITDTSPTYMTKVDWYVTPKHHLEYTGVWNKTKASYKDFSNGDGNFYQGIHQDLSASYTIETGGKVDILKYTGHLTDNLSISILGGKLTNLQGKQNPEAIDPVAANCVRAYDSRANAGLVNYIGCWNESQVTISDPNFQDNQDERKAIRADIDWKLGDHAIRFGYDGEKFSSSHKGTVYTGGAYWRHYLVTQAAGRTVNGVLLPQGTSYARLWNAVTGSGLFEIDNTAMYIEDNWQILPNLMLYGGLRNETFKNMNSSGEAFVEAKKLIAPRLGFSWDVTGDSKLKVFGTAGRYYIPVSSNTNIRSSGIEYTEQTFWRTTGVDLATGLPIGKGDQIGNLSLNGSYDAPEPTAVTTANLKPMYQDEYILGLQKNLGNGLTLGGRAIYRKVGAGMDDHCSKQPYLSWAEDNGYGETIDLTSIASCQLINPGRDVELTFDATGDGETALYKIDKKYFQMPEYKRTYKALELFGQYRADKLSINGSYTLSYSEGNVEGYVNTSLGQEDAGATQDFDNFLFEVGADGYLPNDRRHSLKLFGNYKLTDEINIGANLLVQSGRPINCFGYVDLADAGYDADHGLASYSASSFFCAKADGTKSVAQRGTVGTTPWTKTLDLTLQYKPTAQDGRITFQADIYNLFNTQEITAVNEASQYNGSADPLFNPNYLNARSYQTPRSVRLTMRYAY